MTIQIIKQTVAFNSNHNLIQLLFPTVSNKIVFYLISTHDVTEIYRIGSHLPIKPRHILLLCLSQARTSYVVIFFYVQ